MYHIGFSSEDPAIQGLLDAYNDAESGADEDRLEKTLVKAVAALKDYVPAEQRQQLIFIIAMCQMALGELNMQQVVNYGGRDDVREAAERMIARLAY